MSGSELVFADSMAPIAEALDAARSAEEAGQWDEALSIYNAALREWRPRGGAPACELLRKTGCVHYYRGDFEIALDLFEAARHIAGGAALADQFADATNCLGVVRQAMGQLDAAVDLYRAAQRIAVSTGNEKLGVMIDQNLGIIASIRGDTDEALGRYRAALAGYRALGDRQKAARALNNMGMVYVDMRRWSDAEAAFDNALREMEELGDPETLGTVHLNRAELYLAMERYDEVLECCEQGFEIFARIESRSGLGETYKLYGILYRATGKLHLAEAHLSMVAELAESADQPLLEAEAEAELALVHLAQGRNRDALKSLNRAHGLFQILKARRELVDVETHLDRLEQSYLQVVRAWGESIESVDRYTAGHCERVADYTCRLAEAVGFTGRELTWLRMGAFLHDVGKTTVDVAVLNKPSGLDPREWEVMRRHTVAGDEIVAELGFPYDIRPMVRSHHERWDGDGYPDGLAGEQIPFIGRILCIADVYDALTSTRRYRRAFSSQEALEIMAGESGRSFDPDLFETFRSLVTEQFDVDADLSSERQAV